MGKVKEQRAEHGPTPEAVAAVMAEWRYFDNGGETADRYCCWQGEVEGAVNMSAYLDMSADPFDPQGIGMHGEGLHPDVLTTDPDDNPLGEEVSFDSLPPQVRRCIVRDAEAIASDGA